MKNKSHQVTAKVTIPDEGAEGVLLALGGETGGYSFYIKNNKLRYTHNYLGKHYNVVSEVDVPTGDVKLRFKFDYSGTYGDGEGKAAKVTLFINDSEVGSGTIKNTVPARYSLETQDVGMDLLSPVAHAYESKSPFAFTGTIKKVKIDIEEPPCSGLDCINPD